MHFENIICKGNISLGYCESPWLGHSESLGTVNHESLCPIAFNALLTRLPMSHAAQMSKKLLFSSVLNKHS